MNPEVETLREEFERCVMSKTANPLFLDPELQYIYD